MITLAVTQYATDWTDELVTDLEQAVEKTFVEAIPEELDFSDDEITMPVEVDLDALRRSPGARRPVHRHVTRRGA